MRTVILVVLVFLASGCTTVSPVQVAFAPGYMEHRDSKSRGLTGEACSWSFLGLPIGGDAGVTAAMEVVGGSSDTLVLTWVSVDSVTTSYLLASRKCTRATGYFIARAHNLGGHSAETKRGGVEPQTPSSRRRSWNRSEEVETTEGAKTSEAGQKDGQPADGSREDAAAPKTNVVIDRAN